jgi:hypothetical protein
LANLLLSPLLVFTILQINRQTKEPIDEMTWHQQMHQRRRLVDNPIPNIGLVRFQNWINPSEFFSSEFFSAQNTFS